MLIDFGTTELPRGTPTLSGLASDHMPVVAADTKVCGGQLTAVVGFAPPRRPHQRVRDRRRPEVRRGHQEPEAQGRPALRTEDPDAATTPARRPATPTPKASRGSSHAGRGPCRLDPARHPFCVDGPWLREGASFLGQDNISNESAVRNSSRWARLRGRRRCGPIIASSSGLERPLPGVKVRVLGPPDLTQTEKIRKMRAKDPDEFWHLLAGPGHCDLPALLRGSEAPPSARCPCPRSARWFRDRLDACAATSSRRSRILDDDEQIMSLILFEVFGRSCPPGDAQIENWGYALRMLRQDKTLALPADVDVYKVGHHGSLNATPKKLLGRFSGTCP